MKHENLKIMTENGINVPKFITVSKNDEIDLSFSDAELFAVRSSFAAEDDTDVSFAGQFDTFLNVKREDVKIKASEVAASTHSKSAAAYSEAQDIKASDTDMHIIIQEMVNADLSGVIFTANPRGILNETVIVIGEGLGSNVVEDKVATTSYFYNRDDRIYYYERQENSPLLSEEILNALIDVSERIRDIFSYHTDIEFAIKNGIIYILQARPITTIKAKNPIILDNSNITESYPGVSLPLTQDFVKEIYHGIFYRLIERITKNSELVTDIDRYLADMIDIANWRIYYRISNWYAVLKLLPFSKKLIPIWQKMMGIGNTLVSFPDDIKVPRAAKRAVLKSFFHYLHHTPIAMEELNKNFAERFSSYCAEVDKCETPEELLNVYKNIKMNILSDWDLTLINDMYTFVYTALAGKKNKELIANVKNLESMKPAKAICELSECANRHGMESKEYKALAKEYIASFGDRCLGELKLETETYRTNPERLDEYIKKRMADSPFEHGYEKDGKKSKNPFVKRAKLGIQNREISRMNRSRIFGLSRKIFLKIGDFLAKNGQIENRRDVFYLRMSELTLRCDLRDTVSARKAEKQNFEKAAPYSRLVFADKVINQTSVPNESNILSGNDTLTGIASSVGYVHGEVLVIDVPDDRIDTKGKILVTQSTDPGWVFLLQDAIGIIAEKGSLLSHTAIISRELHKPAIVGVKDCTKLLKSGDIVELDAYEGKIKILKNG